MLQIALSGSKQEVLLAAYVLELVFEGVRIGSKTGSGDYRCIELTAQQLPANAMMLTILKQADQVECEVAIPV